MDSYLEVCKPKGERKCHGIDILVLRSQRIGWKGKSDTVLLTVKEDWTPAKASSVLCDEELTSLLISSLACVYYKCTMCSSWC